MQYENTKNSGESGVFKECSSDINCNGFGFLYWFVFDVEIQEIVVVAKEMNLYCPNNIIYAKIKIVCDTAIKIVLQMIFILQNFQT